MGYGISERRNIVRLLSWLLFSWICALGTSLFFNVPTQKILILIKLRVNVEYMHFFSAEIHFEGVKSALNVTRFFFFLNITL